jgi:hypothetical protein
MCPFFYKFCINLIIQLLKCIKKKSVHWEQTLYKQINLIQN